MDGSLGLCDPYCKLKYGVRASQQVRCAWGRNTGLRGRKAEVWGRSAEVWGERQC